MILWSLTTNANSYGEFSTQYTLGSGKTAKILIFSPTSSSAHLPIFIWVHGTNCKYDDSISRGILASFAERGLVSASIEYADGYLAGNSCNVVQPKAKQIFSPTAGTAISAILAMVPAADPTKGILVAGFSQGSSIAALSKVYNSNVRAAWLLSTGTTKIVGITFDLSCIAASLTGLTQMRAINGIGDPVDGGGYRSSDSEMELINRENLKGVTGVCLECTGLSASLSNGVGWEMVPNSAVVDGVADHFYFYKSLLSAEPDANWDSTEESWGRKYNVNWLLNQLP